MINSRKNHINKLKVNADGEYRWCYEVDLFRNPTVLITLYKVFGGIIIGCAITLILVIWASTNEFKYALSIIKGLGITGIILFILVTMGYFIYAMIQGGKYCLIFEMNKSAISHIQIAKQFKKTQIIGTLLTLAGTTNSSVNLMGTGILVGSRASMKTKFVRVNSIKAKKRRNVIYLHSNTGWNQIYAEYEIFDEVLDFIYAHVPNPKLNIKKE